jgi:hypothetical protein
MEMINIGFGNLISTSHLIAVILPDSAPSKRLVQNGKDQGIVIDATHGKKTKSILIMDSGHIILSALTSETIGKRIKETEQ